jgi:hypothetical protein
LDNFADKPFIPVENELYLGQYGWSNYSLLQLVIIDGVAIFFGKVASCYL